MKNDTSIMAARSSLAMLSREWGSTAMHALEELGGRRAVATMCIGVGQGIAALIERV